MAERTKRIPRIPGRRSRPNKHKLLTDDRLLSTVQLLSRRTKRRASHGPAVFSCRDRGLGGRLGATANIVDGDEKAADPPGSAAFGASLFRSRYTGRHWGRKMSSLSLSK